MKSTTAYDDQFAPEPIQELEQKHHDKIVGIIAEKIEAERRPAPHGWKLVPVEPTEDMTAAGFEALMAWDVRTGDDMGIEDTYSAMLAAAPTPPAATAAPSDEEIDAIAASMPDGAGGMLKQWGYRQFARALLARYGGQQVESSEQVQALRELEGREQRDEALLRQALEALGRARQTAMEQTLKARIPECAEFAGIAQDLDFVVAVLAKGGEA